MKKRRLKESAIVLVGTYKGDQLKNWPGWYNYPVEDDFSRVERADRVDGRAVSPKPPKPHGTHYAIFKTELLYRHKLDVPADAERVIVRTADSAKRSPEIAKQLKAYLVSPDLSIGLERAGIHVVIANEIMPDFAATFYEYLRAVAETNPKYTIFENVSVFKMVGAAA